MSSIVPEVNAQTRVVAILGITDADPYEGDGWLAADFCLLNQLIKDKGLEQVWFHMVDFVETTLKCGPILHGQPYMTRKAVYQEGMTLEHLRRCPKGTLKDDFLNCIKRMALDSKPDDRLLVILIGHGFEPPDFGLWIGDSVEMNAQDHIDNLIQTKDVADILQSYPLVSKRIISSSYCSGNWICSNSSQSVFNEDADSDSVNGSVKGTYSEISFMAALCDILRRTQCRGTTIEQTGNMPYDFDHLWPSSICDKSPKFSTKNNTWEDSVPKHTDLAQKQYQARFDALPEYPACPAEEETNRQRAERRRSRLIKSLLRKYEYIQPGRRTAASNVNVDAKINIYNGNVPGRTLDTAMQGWLILALDHRLRLALIARWIVIEAKLLPFPRFSDWNADADINANEWPSSYKDDKETFNKRVDEAFQVLWRFPHLLPKPPILKPRIHQFQKPINYVAHAAASKALDRLELHSRLCRISLAVNPEISLPSDVYL